MNKKVDDNESYKPISCFISERAFSFLNELSKKLGWNQHEIVSKAIEILWESAEEETPEPGNPLASQLNANEQLMRKVEELEQRIADLEARK